jgi:hypothetical protein
MIPGGDPYFRPVGTHRRNGTWTGELVTIQPYGG